MGKLAKKYQSKALVDSSGFGKTVGDIQGDFSLLEFLDYCTVLEGIVIHDELIPVAKLSRNNMSWQSEIDKLHEEGVLSKETIESNPLEVGNMPNNSCPHPRNRNKGYIARSSIVDSWYETGRLLGAEKKTGISSLPLLRQRSFYEKYATVKEEHTFSSLIWQHKDLSHALQELRRKERYKLKPYYIVPIPPIPLLVLERSIRKEDFLLTALELRNEFEDLRNSLTELRQVLDDNDINPIEARKYRISWEKTWGTLGKYKNSGYSIDIADTLKESINLEGSLDGISIDSISLSKLLEKAFSEANRFRFQRRIRVLHKAAKNYITASDASINKQIQRFYNINIKKKDFELLKEFGIDPEINV